MNKNIIIAILVAALVLVGGYAIWKGLLKHAPISDQTTNTSQKQISITDSVSQKNEVDHDVVGLYPKVSQSTATFIVGTLGLKFSFPDNLVNKGSLTADKGEKGYMLGQSFFVTARDAIGGFTYNEPSFSYGAVTDDFVTGGGSDGGLTRRNTIKETINLNNGYVIVYEHGGEASGWDSENVWTADPAFAQATVKVDKMYNGSHFSEMVFTNRNLSPDDFKKIIQSVRPL